MCALLPPRRAGLARVVALGTVVLAAGCLVSLLPSVLTTGDEVERRLGELVPQVSLTLRADGAGLGAVLVSSVAALLALLERERRPLERAAVLICLLGTAVAGLGGNAVLLFAGVELGSVGALLMATAAQAEAATPVASLAALRRRDRLSFGLQHLAALGLLLAVARLQNQFQTSDLNALPTLALGTGFAAAWALTGVVRLLAGLGLPREPTPVSSAWAPVAAVPTGWLVLHRLDELTAGTLPPLLAPLLVLVGTALLVGFGLVALWRTGHPERCGRALCAAGAGLPIAAAGLGGTDGPVLGALGAVALVLTLSVAPGFAPVATAENGGPVSSQRRTAAACLAVAGGLPLGLGLVVALGLADAAAVRGPREIPAALGFGVGAVLLALVGGRAVRRTLDSPAGHQHLTARPNLVGALAMAALAGLFPGAVVRGVDRCLGVAGVRAVDLAAFRGPGGGWFGGYLLAGVCLLLVGGWAALRLLESEGRRPAWLRVATPLAARALTAPVVSPATAAEAPPTPPPSPPVPGWLRRADRALVGVVGAADRADRWLVGQPNLVTLALAAFVLLFVYR